MTTENERLEHFIGELPLGLLKDVTEALGCAETVDCMRDLKANLEDAEQAASQLLGAIKELRALSKGKR